MKVLFIAPRFVLPADTGGKIRTYNLIKQIAKFAELHVISFSFEKDDGRYLADLEKNNIKATLIPFKDTPFLKKMLMALGPIPFSAAKYYSQEMAATVRTLIEKHDFDLVHVDHIHMAHYQSCFGSLPCLVDEHNVEYKILERCGNVERVWWKQQLYFQQAGKMKRFEAAMVPRYSACTAVSPDDADVLQELSAVKVPVHVLPNGVDTEFFQPNFAGPAPQKEEDAMVFTGSMDWLPNDDAMLYFIKDILPFIWEKNPQIKLYVVGKSPSPALMQAQDSDERIIITQRVEDVRPYLAKAKVFVTPLRIGGGTRLKILEALSMEKAIVSTAIGAEGINYKEDVHMAVADRPQEFAKKVLALMAAPEKRTALGQSGRHLVLAEYDWNIMGKKLKEIYEGLTHD